MLNGPSHVGDCPLIWLGGIDHRAMELEGQIGVAKSDTSATLTVREGAPRTSKLWVHCADQLCMVQSDAGGMGTTCSATTGVGQACLLFDHACHTDYVVRHATAARPKAGVHDGRPDGGP